MSSQVKSNKSAILTSNLYVEDNPGVVLAGGLPDILNESLHRLVAVVAEDANSVHAVFNHLVDELTGGSLVNGAKDPGVSLLDAEQTWIQTIVMFHALHLH